MKIMLVGKDDSVKMFLSEYGFNETIIDGAILFKTTLGVSNVTYNDKQFWLCNEDEINASINNLCNRTPSPLIIFTDQDTNLENKNYSVEVLENIIVYRDDNIDEIRNKINVDHSVKSSEFSFARGMNNLKIRFFGEKPELSANDMSDHKTFEL